MVIRPPFLFIRPFNWLIVRFPVFSSRIPEEKKPDPAFIETDKKKREAMMKKLPEEKLKYDQARKEKGFGFFCYSRKPTLMPTNDYKNVSTTNQHTHMHTPHNVNLITILFLPSLQKWSAECNEVGLANMYELAYLIRYLNANGSFCIMRVIVLPIGHSSC